MNLKRGNFLTRNNILRTFSLLLKDLISDFYTIASWQSSTPSTPVEKDVVNWRVQVFANSTVNLHFHCKYLAVFPV